jgi:CheY-like chemotaxis protein
MLYRCAYRNKRQKSAAGFEMETKNTIVTRGPKENFCRRQIQDLIVDVIVGDIRQMSIAAGAGRQKRRCSGGRRELRMIKLKKEINELFDRQGQPPCHSLEFEKETKRLVPSEATNHLPGGLVKLLTERPRERSPKENASRKSQTKGRGTILVVDDEPYMLRLLEKILSKQGYRVLTAADGEEAIEVHRSHKEAIDIILLDLGLPKISGQDVLVRLKTEKPEVKIVVASGYLEPDLSSVIERAGVKHFVQKPYDLDEVVKIVQRL